MINCQEKKILFIRSEASYTKLTEKYALFYHQTMLKKKERECVSKSKQPIFKTCFDQLTCFEMYHIMKIYKKICRSIY